MQFFQWSKFAFLSLSLLLLSSCGFVSEISLKSLTAAETPLLPDYTVCSSSITNDFGGGLGTSTYPYLICNLQQWNFFAQTTSSWNKYIKLKSDLDFSGVVFADLKTVSHATEKFSGNFDGGGFKFLNISVDAGATPFALFGNTTGNPVFKNFSIENFNLTTTVIQSSLVRNHATGGVITLENLTLKNAAYIGQSAGGFVYTSDGGMNVQNVSVQTLNMPTRQDSAGIVSRLTGDATFNNVTIDGMVTTYACCFLEDRVGGLVAYVLGSPVATTVNITNTIVKNSNLGGSTVVHYVGGMIGRAIDANVNITDSSFSGTIYGGYSAGLLGQIEEMMSADRVFTSLRNSANITIPNCGNSLCGGIVGWISADAVITANFTKGTATIWTGGFGGLTAQTDGDVTINDSYSQINFTRTGNSGVNGGLTNVVSGGTLTINRSYYTGTFNFTGGGAPSRGCIVGANFGTLNLVDTYFDSTICTDNAVNSGAYAGATGLATAALRTATPFNNWLPAVWVFANAQNPKLSFEP